MTYKNILVHVDGTAAAEHRVEAAVAMSKRFGCPVTGAFVSSSPFREYVFDGAGMPMPQQALEEYLEECTRQVEAASRAARGAFANATDQRPDARWVDLNGDSKDDLVRCARRHDLTILPPTISPAFGDVTYNAGEIGMASGGPVLILKHGGYPIDFGRNILIAWNDSRESTRALRDAWPFLETAKSIHFLKVGRGSDRELDSAMRQLLKDHGCPEPRIHVDENDESAVEDLIRLYTGRTGADLAVLGLYGHSRLQEIVFGGVSRDLLSNPPIPLLMSH